jgi:pimeloyl-ACP methyl ester carboxylesterase
MPDPKVPATSPSGAFEPSGFALASDGVSVAFYDLGGTGPSLLLAHATGFCAGTLVPLARSLVDRFRCVALDLRGHGASVRPASGNFDWHGFALDVLAVVEEADLESPAAFGHSCGGAAILLAEEHRPGTFQSLYCFEPIVFPTDEPRPPSTDNPLSLGASRRRSSFASRQEALSNFTGKPPFDRFRPDVLAAYVDNGFSAGPDGRVHLRCRREDEAQIYSHSVSHDAYAHMNDLRCGVALACGELTDSIGPEWLGRFSARIELSTTVVLPDTGHFAPFEDPDAVATSVSESLIQVAGTERTARKP